MYTATLAALIVALASPALAAGPYPIKADGVRCRSGPGTSHTVVKTYYTTDSVYLDCQTEGTSVNGLTAWDHTTDGCYVSDYYVKTGTASYVTPACGSTNPSSSACTKLNAAGIALIKEFEGFVKNVEPDPIGLPTVGYGHLCKSTGCAEVPYPFPLTEATATALLNDDLPTYSSCVAKALTSSVVTLNDNQFAALTSWTFNVGCGNMKSSSLIKRLNAGETPNTVAAEELPKWNKAGGSVLAGLTRRRTAEVKLFQTASSKQAFPKCT